MHNRLIQPTGLIGLNALVQGLFSLTGNDLGRIGRWPLGSETAFHRGQYIPNFEGFFDEVVHATALLQILSVAPTAVHRTHHDDGNVAITLTPLDTTGDVEAVHLG